MAVLPPNFGNLAVFQVGWPYDFGFGFFWPFLKVVWPKSFSVGRFDYFLLAVLNMSIAYFKAKLSTTTPFLKSGPLCVRFALCSEI